jgi:iron complex transport system substrate-binding protein
MKKILLALLACAATWAQATVSVVDDTGKRVTLAHPARRVISMAPHVTELLFAAGGGNRVVGAMNYSDYPAAAKSIPLIGSNSQIDLERMVALKPDLLIVWQSGNTARQLEQLASLGIPVFYSEPRRLAQVADSLLRFGQLLGTQPAHRQPGGHLRQTPAGARVLPGVGPSALYPQRRADRQRRDPPVRRPEHFRRPARGGARGER